MRYLCKWSALGICGFLAVLTILLALPGLFGIHPLLVQSGSMEPEYAVGSVIYVAPTAPEEIQENEIIAFWSGDSIITHRVMENHLVEGEFVTKGDANAAEDMREAPYDSLIGRVSRHIPVLGSLMALYTSTVGKAYAVCFAACGAMLNILAGRIRRNR